jgi:hypothetical protein
MHQCCKIKQKFLVALCPLTYTDICDRTGSTQTMHAYGIALDVNIICLVMCLEIRVENANLDMWSLRMKVLLCALYFFHQFSGV